jgi:hypothetical protein
MHWNVYETPLHHKLQTVGIEYRKESLFPFIPAGVSSTLHNTRASIFKSKKFWEGRDTIHRAFA